MHFLLRTVSHLHFISAIFKQYLFLDEEFEEQLVIKPEVVYFKNESDIVEVGAESLSDTSETKDLVPLEPLVEYMNVYDDAREEVELSSDATCNMEEVDRQTGRENVIIESEYVTNNNDTQEISVVSSDVNNLGIEPVMPFFLTSSPMFTILNENNEVRLSFFKIICYIQCVSKLNSIFLGCHSSH